MKIRRRVTVKTQWKCDKCGHTTAGKPLKCPECGDIKERHEHYSLPEVLEKTEPAPGDANKLCVYCNANVKSDAKRCGHCGGDLENALAVQPNFGLNVTSAPDGQYQPQPKQDVSPAVLAEKTTSDSSGAWNDESVTNFRPRRDWIIIAIVGAAIVAIIGFIIWASGSHDTEGIIAARNWTCVTTLYRTADKRDSSWCSSMPGDASEINRESRQHGTEDCHPHECVVRTGSDNCNCREVNCHIDRSSCSDNADGTASCDEVCDRECDKCPDEMGTCYDQCAVYDDWCEFSHPVERAVGNQTNRGQDDVPVCPVIGTGSRERTSSSVEFSVTVNSSEGAKVKSVGSVDEYRTYRTGDRCVVTVGNLGGIRDIRLK